MALEQTWHMVQVDQGTLQREPFWFDHRPVLVFMIRLFILFGSLA